MMERLDASIRRQLLLDDRDIVGKPFPLEGNTARFVQANTRHLTLLLLDTDIKNRASRAAAFAANLMDASIAHHLKETIACARGCPYCCTTYVSTSLPEVFRMARAVRGNAPTTERVNTAAARTKAMPQLQREVTRVICPILDNNACSQYDVRPMVCRVVMSTSLESCVRIFTQSANEPFAAPKSLDALRSYLMIILRTALVLAGLPHKHYELAHALEIALADPDSEERWLAGEPIFEPVAVDRLDLTDSPISNLVNVLVGAVRPTI
jgi:Fe-S-cluster containining protein